MYSTIAAEVMPIKSGAALAISTVPLKWDISRAFYMHTNLQCLGVGSTIASMELSPEMDFGPQLVGRPFQREAVVTNKGRKPVALTWSSIKLEELMTAGAAANKGTGEWFSGGVSVGGWVGLEWVGGWSWWAHGWGLQRDKSGLGLTIEGECLGGEEWDARGGAGARSGSSCRLCCEAHVHQWRRTQARRGGCSLRRR